MPTKVPVSERAVIARINRKLKHDGRQLKTKRGRWREDISGPYYILDVDSNSVVSGGQARSRIDLEELARELEVLADYERMEN